MSRRRSSAAHLRTGATDIALVARRNPRRVLAVAATGALLAWLVLSKSYSVVVAQSSPEFALWLNLKDVYWEKQGRRSIDAVIIAAAVSGVLLISLRSWIDVTTKVADEIQAIVGAIGLLGVILALLNAAKEKFGMAIWSILVPVVGLVPERGYGRPRRGAVLPPGHRHPPPPVTERHVIDLQHRHSRHTPPLGTAPRPRSVAALPLTAIVESQAGLPGASPDMRAKPGLPGPFPGQ